MCITFECVCVMCNIVCVQALKKILIEVTTAYNMVTEGPHYQLPIPGVKLQVSPPSLYTHVSSSPSEHPQTPIDRMRYDRTPSASPEY